VLRQAHTGPRDGMIAGLVTRWRAGRVPEPCGYIRRVGSVDPFRCGVSPSPNRACTFQRTRLSRDWRLPAIAVIGSSFIGAARLTSNTKDSQGVLQLIVNPNVNPLAPFAVYAAFPRSDYYGASDAHMFHWVTAPLRI